jgi:hypothetical protein
VRVEIAAFHHPEHGMHEVVFVCHVALGEAGGDPPDTQREGHGQDDGEEDAGGGSPRDRAPLAAAAREAPVGERDRDRARREDCGGDTSA